jgi:hypothetical protein
VIGTSVKFRKGLARFGVRALFAAGLLSTLGGCAYWDLWDGDPAALLTDSSKWVVLPMRAFVSHENVEVEGMQLCTLKQCGYDAAIERFKVSGSDAKLWEDSLAHPRQLAALIAKPHPKSTIPPPSVDAQPFATGQWTGIQLAMTGGKKQHHLSAYVVGNRHETSTTFIVVMAAQADIARRLILEAAQ